MTKFVFPLLCVITLLLAAGQQQTCNASWGDWMGDMLGSKSSSTTKPVGVVVAKNATEKTKITLPSPQSQSQSYEQQMYDASVVQALLDEATNSNDADIVPINNEVNNNNEVNDDDDDDSYILNLPYSQSRLVAEPGREYEMHIPVPATLNSNSAAAAMNNFNNLNNNFYEGDVILPGGAFVARDVEHQTPYLPALFQNKPLMLSGGAGEGQQALGPDGDFPNVHEIKTDSLLPAYCDPPNPCPLGFTANDGCIESVPNTAEFSRDYQQRQDCQCDSDHMFDCANGDQARKGESNSGGGPYNINNNAIDIIDGILGNQHKAQQHKGLVAKKYHIEGSNSIISYERNLHPRRRRDTQHGNHHWTSGSSSSSNSDPVLLTKRVAKKSAAPRRLTMRE